MNTRRQGEPRAPAWPSAGTRKPLPAQIATLLAEAGRELRSEREQAVLRLERAVSAARTFDDPELLVHTLHEAAVILQRAHRPDRAFIMCLEAQPMIERMDDAWLALQLVLLRGTCYLDVGQHDRARQLIDQASQGFAALGDLAMVGRCHSAMARACGLVADLHAAVGHAEKATACQSLSDTGSDPLRQCLEDEARWRLLLGQQLALAKQPEQAREQWLRAATALPDPLATGSAAPGGDSTAALDAAVGIFNALGDRARCRTALQRLVGAARRSRSSIDMGLAWLRLADFHVACGKRSRAIACARRAARRLPRSSQEPNRLMAQFQLARLLEADGDLRGAYEVHCDASTVEALLDKEAALMQGELLALDLEAEQQQRMSERTLQYAQRLTNVGRVVAGINHDISQPMASIRMLAETGLDLQDTDPRALRPADAVAMHDLGSALVDLVARLPAFDGLPADETMRVNINRALEESLAAVRSRMSRTACELVRDVPDVEVAATEDRLVNVLAQLLNNALDAMEDCAPRRLHVHAGIEGGVCRLHIEDSGPGFGAAALERLFQPFSSTRPHRLGLGLGLALSREALRSMKGDLSASNLAAGGAALCISLPIAQAWHDSTG